MTTSMLSRMQKVELLKRMASNPSIPSPPTVVLQVLDKASKPDCTIGDLCQLIQMDPGLCGRVLRIVNSAMFGLSRPATSIQRAMAVVGLTSTRLLILAISFPEMQQKMAKTDTNVKQRYWKASVAGAIVARELSQRMRAGDPEDDMAAGLLRDLGELILQQLLPEAYQHVLDQPAEALIYGKIDLEETHCALNHAEVSAFVLDRWRLPTEMTEAIRHHHQPDLGVYSSPVAKDRAFRLHFATRASQLLLHPDQSQVLKDLRELAQTHYQMSEEQLHEFLLPLSKKITDFAALLQIDIGEASDYHDVLTQASEELVHLTVVANLDNQRIAEASHRAESEARRWREEAVFDSLTKVFNRRFLESKMRELFERPSADATPFGLLFLDLDGFKPLNDRYGHPFGDLVLQKVADCLSQEVRQRDIVARYGGDEFCLLTEPIDQLGLHNLSHRVWTRINELTVTQGDCEGKVGASIGSVYFEPAAQWESAEQILAAADRAMYMAKAQGKNRVVFWNSLTTVAKPAPVGDMTPASLG
jgi:two-component system, cell cycle response regulator